MDSKMNYSLISLFIFFFSLFSCEEQRNLSPHLSKKIIKKIYPSIVEVVVPKKEDSNISYERPLPFDHLDFHIRNDKYNSIGTAFFIAPNRLASAAHVFSLDESTLWTDFYIRSLDGKVHKVKNVLKYNQYRDYIEFDLESYPDNFEKMTFAPKVEVGDMVYAVGNALGEGISTRGGQVSSFTPEHVAGLWNYIRFSSPASPGNSGGPLVNSKGQVVGVIVMKNNSENLNFALPITEVKNVNAEMAHFFLRDVKVQDGNQLVKKDWKETLPLPKTLDELREKSIPSKNSFYKNLINNFQESHKHQLFPRHPRYRNYLRNQRSPIFAGRIDKDPNRIQWDVEFTHLKKIMLAEGQAIFQGKGEIFSHVTLIETPKKETLKSFFQNGEKLANIAMRTLGAHRSMAGESIPITSYGPPHKTRVWRDKLGRPWRSYHWDISFNNTFMAIHSTPTPRGVLNFIDVHWASQLNEGYLHFVKENILEVIVSYGGGFDQWNEFLSLPKEMSPLFTRPIEMSYVKGSFSLQTKDFKIKTNSLKIGPDSKIIARIGGDPSKLLAPKVVAWEVLEKKARKTGFIIAKLYSPNQLSTDAHKERWEELNNNLGRFNGKQQSQDGLITLKYRLAEQSQSIFWSEQGPLNISSNYVASCFSEQARGKRWPSKVCKEIKSSFRETK